MTIKEVLSVDTSQLIPSSRAPSGPLANKDASILHLQSLSPSQLPASASTIASSGPELMPPRTPSWGYQFSGTPSVKKTQGNRYSSPFESQGEDVTFPAAVRKPGALVIINRVEFKRIWTFFFKIYQQRRNHSTFLNFQENNCRDLGYSMWSDWACLVSGRSSFPFQEEVDLWLVFHSDTLDLFFMEVELNYNVVLVSGVQQRESVIHTYTSILFEIFFPI